MLVSNESYLKATVEHCIIIRIILINTNLFMLSRGRFKSHQC